VAEGGGLLNRCRTKSSTGGSNPPLSASKTKHFIICNLAAKNTPDLLAKSGFRLSPENLCRERREANPRLSTHPEKRSLDVAFLKCSTGSSIQDRAALLHTRTFLAEGASVLPAPAEPLERPWPLGASHWCVQFRCHCLQARRIAQKQKWAGAIAKVAGFSGAGRLASTGRMSFWAGSSQPTELTHPRRSAHGPVPWFGRLQ
jgi:hypothetical protein